MKLGKNGGKEANVRAWIIISYAEHKGAEKQVECIVDWECVLKKVGDFTRGRCS